MAGVSCRLVNNSGFKWSLTSCDMHTARSLSTLWCRKISANWLLVRPLMLGLSFLSFHGLRFFACSVGISHPREGTRDTIDGSSYKQKLVKNNARNHHTTTQNKPLIISEGLHDNFRPHNIFKLLGCTWMKDHKGIISNLDGIGNGGLSAQCLVVDYDPLTETLSLVSCLRDRK